MTRLEFFKEHKDGLILRKFETRDFLEVTVDRYGDVLTYRVYGNDESDYRLYEV